MTTTQHDRTAQVLTGERCPCGHLANRHRNPDPSFRVGDLIEVRGACRDCSCRGEVAVAPDAEASLPDVPLRDLQTPEGAPHMTTSTEDLVCETRCSKAPAYLEVRFDTTYDYSDDQGRGCGDLHACYVAKLGAWLDERGVSWAWQNEFTSETHGGEDRYARLTDLMQGGADATAWFQADVLPAIRRMFAAGGTSA